MSSERSPRVLAVVLAGGRGSRLGGLTEARCKPAMPFGGSCRTIDFVLSNCAKSGLDRVGVVTQYHGQSLIRHLSRAWLAPGSGAAGRIEVWPADQRHGGDWYSGTANAVHANLDMIAESRPDMVLVLAADHVYNMDYRRLVRAHRASGAEMTVASVEVDGREARHFGVLVADSDGRIRRFEEKPANVVGMTTPAGAVLASMGIYLFNTDTLVRELKLDASDRESGHDFGRNIIPRMIDREGARVHCFRFRDAHDGAPAYWRDIGTVQSYWRAHMDLLGPSPSLCLGTADSPMPSSARPLPPPRFLTDECTGDATVLLDALVAPGCTLKGTLVRESVLFSAVQVDSGSVLEQCVVLPGARIGRNCRLSRVVVDEGEVVPDGTVIDNQGQVVVLARRGDGGGPARPPVARRLGRPVGVLQAGRFAAVASAGVRKGGLVS